MTARGPLSVCVRVGCSNPAVAMPVIAFWCSPAKNHPAAEIAMPRARHCESCRRTAFAAQLITPRMRYVVEERALACGRALPDWSTAELRWADPAEPRWDPDRGFPAADGQDGWFLL